MNTNSLDETRRLLSESNQSMREIADGAGVNYWWLRKFKLGGFRNPGVLTVEKLHDYLAQQSRERSAA